jgi:hypothetical protein
MRAKVLLAACALFLASASLSVADERNRQVTFTFDKPVSIPAVHQPGYGVLPPGTYVFKIFDSSAQRHIVQIFNKDETEIYATILAIPNMRLKVTGKVVLTFRETPAGQPAALRAMFYPGRQYGEEFVYQKARATELARLTLEPVLSMPAALEKEEAKPEAPEIVAELEQTPVNAVEPAGNEVQTAEVVTPPPAELQVASNVHPTAELPMTASPLPLIGLMGLLALSVGFALRLAEKRLAAARQTR